MTRPRLALAAALLALPLARDGRTRQVESPTEVAIFAADPAHPWNRVHAALFARRGPDGRVYGVDALDPILYPHSTWLLSSPRSGEALAALDALLASDPARDPADPLRRIAFQRDLWAVFDWLATRDAPAARELRARLARAMARVALSDEELEALEDNGAHAAAAGVLPGAPTAGAPDAPFLPADLFALEGDWVALRDERVFPLGPLALRHAEHVAGRSWFTVLLRLPPGRAATLAHLAQIAARPASSPCDEPGCSPFAGGAHEHFDPSLTELPAGTGFALVRRALCITRSGRLATTPLVESVQLRVLLDPTAPEGERSYDPSAWSARQAACEFVLSRRALFAGEAGGLAPVDPTSPRFDSFSTHGGDPFEEASEHFSGASVPFACVTCHGAPGIISMNSYTRIASGPGALTFLPLDHRPSRLAPTSVGWLQAEAARWKAERYDWGLFAGLMEGSERPPAEGG